MQPFVRLSTRTVWLGMWLILLFVPGTLVAQSNPRALEPTPAKKLDPKMRVKMVAALAGLAILGFAIIAATWLGGRYTRRIVNSKNSRSVSSVEQLTTDEWAKKPLSMEERERLLEMLGE